MQLSSSDDLVDLINRSVVTHYDPTYRDDFYRLNPRVQSLHCKCLVDLTKPLPAWGALLLVERGFLEHDQLTYIDVTFWAVLKTCREAVYPLEIEILGVNYDTLTYPDLCTE